MRTFKALFSCSFNEKILSKTDILSKGLQGGAVTAADAMMRAERNYASSQVFWEQLEERRGSLSSSTKIFGVYSWNLLVGKTYTSELQIYQADLNQEDLQFEITLFESSLTSSYNIDSLFKSLTCLLLLGS